MKFLKSSWVIVLVLLTVMTSCKKEELTTVDTQGIYIGEFKLENISPYPNYTEDDLNIRTNQSVYLLGTFSNEKGNVKEHKISVLPNPEYLSAFNKLLSDQGYGEIINGFTGVLILHGTNEINDIGGYFVKGSKVAEVSRVEEPYLNDNLRTEIPHCDDITIVTSHYIDWYQGDVYLDRQYLSISLEQYSICNDGIPTGNYPNPPSGTHYTHNFIPDSPDDEGPDCNSWQYKKYGDWQECGVSSISLNVIYTQNNSLNSYAHVFTRPMYFGVPSIRLLPSGDTEVVSSNFAAQMSAVAMDYAMDRFVRENRYGPRPSVSTIENTIKNYCEQQLRSLIPGARVSFYSGHSSAPVNPYETTFWGMSTGNCW